MDYSNYLPRTTEILDRISHGNWKSKATEASQYSERYSGMLDAYDQVLHAAVRSKNEELIATVKNAISKLPQDPENPYAAIDGGRKLARDLIEEIINRGLKQSKN